MLVTGDDTGNDGPNLSFELSNGISEEIEDSCSVEFKGGVSESRSGISESDGGL
jgi:hypothetical protein